MLRKREKSESAYTTVTNRRRMIAAATIAMLSSLSLETAVHAAAPYTWDSSGANPTSPVDGGGTWDTATALWSNNGTDQIWTTTSGTTNVAVFGANNGAAGAVSLNGATINAGGVTFNPPGSSSYSLNTGTLNLTTSGTITLANGVSATFGTGLNLDNNGSIFVSGPGDLYENATVNSASGAFFEIENGATVAIDTNMNASNHPLGNGTGGLRLAGGTIMQTGAVSTSDNLGPKFYDGGGTLDMEGTGEWNVSNASIPNGDGLARTVTLTGSSAGTAELTVALGSNTSNAVVSVLKTGSSTWTLGAVNTYTGATTINAGTLAIGSGDSILDSQSINVNASSANVTLKLSNVAALSSTGNITVTTGSYTPTIILNYTGTQTIGSLMVGGVFEPIGTYSTANEPSNDSSLFSGTGSLAVTAVPEPTGFALTALASAGVLSRRRRSSASAVAS